MPTYETTGTLTTIEKSYSTPQTPDLTGLVYTLNGETITVDVVGSPGQAGEEIQSVTLDGASSYNLTWSNAHTSFEVVFDLSTADTSVTPEVDDLTVLGGPDAPTNLTVTEVTDTPGVSLSWVDNATTEDEYRNYRATTPGGTTSDYTLIDTVAADTTTYTDTTATLGTTYYYRVAAYSSRGESPPTNEVRAAATNDFTNAVTWGSEVEWGYGSFSGTTTDGSGGLILAERSTDLSFDYSLSINSSNNSDQVYVRVRDANNNTLESREIGGTDSESATFSVAPTHPQPYELVADLFTENDTGASASASISDSFGHTVSVDDSEGDNVQNTASYDYTYPETGEWSAPIWDFTNITTASALYATTAQPTTTGVDATVATEGGGSTTTTPIADGASTETSIEVSASDRYQLTVELTTDIVDDTTPTPTVDSVTLEAHTPPMNLQITSTTDTSNNLTWDGWPSADAYELYRSESTPVTTADTLLTTTTNTTYTDSGLENGEAYYYNVRGEYTGE